MKLYQNIRNKFYKGPSWVNTQSYFDNFSYRSPTVHFAAWIYAYIVRFFSVPGRYLFLASLPVLSYSTTRYIRSLSDIAIIILAIIFVDIIVGFIFRPLLVITRQIPESIQAGHSLRVKYNVTNKRSLSVWNLSLDDLLLPKGVHYKTISAGINYIPPKESIALESELIVPQRGKYKFYPVIADTSFPFLITKWICRGNNNKFHTLTVFPKYTPLLNFTLPTGKKFQRSGSSMISNIGESLDFHACREFRVGDDPRHIDWASSAKHGDLIIREFHEESISRIALIIDTSIGKESLLKRFLNKLKNTVIYINFEAGLSLVASLTEFLTRGDLVVDIFAAGTDIYHFKGGRSLANLDQILDILSCVEPSSQDSLKKIAPTVIDEISEIGSAVIILLDWDTSRQEFIKELQQYNIALKVILLTNDKNLNNIQDVTIVSSDDILSGKINKI